MKLKDKVFFITGGGNGMGRATAIEAAKEGAIVAFAELSEKNATETTEILQGMNAEATSYIVDVTDESALIKAVQDAEEKYGKIDVLVNNVGFDLPKLVHEAFDKCVNINMKSAYITSKCVLPAMIERNDGVIINISSTAGTNPQKETPIYSAAKAGIMMLTKAMALAYGEYNIRVNSVSPGLTKTTLLAQVSDEYIAALEAVIPLHRMGMPEDIAKAVIYLASDDAKYVTGQIWGVDGGLPLI